MKWRDGPVSLYISNHQYYGVDVLGYTSLRGYDEDGRQRWSYIHCLNAIAWFFDSEEHDSPLEVVDGSHVHHADGCPLNNAEDNLEILDPDEHNGHTRTSPGRPWFYLEEVDVDLEVDESPPVAVADGGRSP